MVMKVRYLSANLGSQNSNQFLSSIILFFNQFLNWGMGVNLVKEFIIPLVLPNSYYYYSSQVN